MYLTTTIKFSEPICKCDEQKISWSVPTIEGKLALKVKCSTCGVEVLIPNSSFKASLDFAIKYPGKKPDQQTTKVDISGMLGDPTMVTV